MKKKILVADDDTDLVQLLRDMLEFEGYETLAAYEGVRTIEAAHKQRPDLILLDVQMPAGTGQSVLKALRSKEATKKIPIIVISGVQQNDLAEEVKKLGAQDFILKPYEKVDLIAKVKNLLS
ncbi:MAG: response regulator [Deltaproteobacteria bacterium]|nr:response regulator [Deltaproteobacteria bacterium]